MYAIRTWTRSLHGKRLKQAVEELKALDSDFLLVAEFSAPGNDVKMWLERPNDGTNDYDYQRALNLKAADVVNRLLEASDKEGGR